MTDMKKAHIFLIILLVILLAFSMPACAQKADDALSVQQMDEIDRTAKFPVDWQRAIYCGSYDGWVVVLEPTELQSHTSVDIAGYSFEYTSTFYLFAYKNGQIQDLDESYENGQLTKEQIAQAHARYLTVYRERFPV